MALFAMNRYLGEDEKEENIPNQADEILKNILKSAEKKKQKLLIQAEQEKESQEESEDDSEEKETPKKDGKSKKKKRKSEKIASDSEADETPAKKKKVKSVKSAKSVQIEDLESDEESSQNDEKDQEEEKEEDEIAEGVLQGDEKDEGIVTKREGQRHSEIGGFTVIGAVQKKKIQKVERVLPEWLSHPTVIQNAVQHHKVPLEGADYLEGDLKEKLRANGISHLFPVQANVIPVLLQRSSHSLGRGGYIPNDICCSAPTGSGKTLAFVLPIIQALRSRLVPHIRALVILPVTDLASQVHKVFQTYAEGTDLKVGLAIGQKAFGLEQSSLVRDGAGGYHSLVDILVATPGRLVDHINQTAGFSLKHLTYLVMDEADRLMDEVKHDWLTRVDEAVYRNTPDGLACGDLCIRRPYGTLTAASTLKPQVPLQKLLFSATLSQNPEKLEELGLFQPKLFTSVVGEEESMEEGDSTTKSSPSDEIVKGEFVGKYTTPSELSEFIVPVTPQDKILVILHMLHHLKFKNVLCFTNSVEATHRLYHLVRLVGDIKVKEFSSKLRVANRERILKQFANDKIQMLICTDSMARGIDISSVKYVISYDKPSHLTTYIHRVGRTARAGKAGTAFTFLQNKEVFHFKKMCKEAGKEKMKEMKFPRSDLKPLIPAFTSALAELEKVLKVENKKTRP